MAKSTWTVDPAHSNLEFVVKHMMMSNLRGRFHQYDATVEADPEDLTTADISFRIDVASVDTDNEKRDGHLKSADFFETETHEYITFEATDIQHVSGNDYDVTGDLTIRDVTKPETFRITAEGSAKDPMSGDEVAGFSGEGKINRKAFGLTWNVALETGGVLVGDDIKISLEFECHKVAV